MKIFHISSECYPVAKVGGLADVVGALPKYQTKLGHNASVIMPCYRTKFVEENDFNIVYSGTFKLGNEPLLFDILKETTNSLGFDLYLVDIKSLFDRKNIYSYNDDIERFVGFQIAALNWINSRTEIPDVINCHDHHTGLIPFMISCCYQYKKLVNIASVITIHNGLYQGIFSFDKLQYIPEFDLIHKGLLEWDYNINSLATALKCAQAITTVSPSYLDEINSFSNGLEPLFNEYRYKSKGILNGIDIDIWNPETDLMLAKNYSINTFKEGKQANKNKLCKLFNLDSTKPLFSFIGRLFDEKGGDLLPEASIRALNENKNEITIFILGSGNPAIENQLNKILSDNHGNYNIYIGYNEELAHLVYASSDYLLMPSRVEPCGLNQMYSMRYGTIPIVRRTGGLRDTVIDFGDNGNGICHDQASVEDICYSINRAVKLYNNKDEFFEIIVQAMHTNHSWEKACKEYVAIYKLIIE